MSVSELVFFFVVLPIIYVILAIILMAAVASTIKQVRLCEYSYRLTYDREKAKIGQDASAKYKSSYALAE